MSEDAQSSIALDRWLTTLVLVYGTPPGHREVATIPTPWGFEHHAE